MFISKGIGQQFSKYGNLMLNVRCSVLYTTWVLWHVQSRSDEVSLALQMKYNWNRNNYSKQYFSFLSFPLLCLPLILRFVYVQFVDIFGFIILKIWCSWLFFGTFGHCFSMYSKQHQQQNNRATNKDDWRQIAKFKASSFN